MKPVHYLSLALFLVATGIALFSIGIHKQVVIDIDGKTQVVSTTALTVRGLLSGEKITVAEKDSIQPPLDEWLKDGETIYIEKAARIYLQADGQEFRLLDPERIPANLLSKLNISLYPGDRIFADGTPIHPDDPLSPGGIHSLQVLRSWPITLHIGTRTRTIHSSAPTLGEALWKAGVILHSSDLLSPAADTPLTGPLTARLERSQPLVIWFRDGELQARSAAKTVGEALNEAGVPLQGLDYSVPPAGDPLPENGEIRIVRVQEEVTLETEPLPFETKTQPLPELELDSQKIVQAGTYGLSGRRVRIRLEDGKEVSRQIEDSFVAQEPEPRIIGYGTKLVTHTLKTSSGNLKYWRALNMYAVSYNPTSAGGTITASGLPLAKGVVAVDTSYVPFGTRLYIPGYGIAVAADTGGGVKGRIIDLGYSDQDYTPWHQWITVYFLWPPPANAPLIIP